MSGFVLGPAVLTILFIGSWPFAFFMMAALAVAFYEWNRMAKSGNQYLLDILLGMFYLPICFLSFYALREWFEAGLLWSLSLILAVWAADTGAYFTGTAIGGPKLAPAISPNKTWAGFGGAMVSAALAMILCFAFADITPLPLEFDAGDYFLAFFVGLIFGAVGQAGDLTISAFKRRSGVKDTGNLIPGHGGLLDRIDSLLLVTPVFAISVLIGFS